MYVCFEFLSYKLEISFREMLQERKNKQKKSVCTDKNISIFSKISKVAETETETGQRSPSRGGITLGCIGEMKRCILNT